MTARYAPPLNGCNSTSAARFLSTACACGEQNGLLACLSDHTGMKTELLFLRHLKYDMMTEITRKSGLSLLLVLVPAPRVFLRVLRFSSLHKNQHFQIPIRSGIRGPQVCQSRDCYVLPSLNIVDLFILFI